MATVCAVPQHVLPSGLEIWRLNFTNSFQMYSVTATECSFCVYNSGPVAIPLPIIIFHCFPFAFCQVTEEWIITAAVMVVSADVFPW